MELFRRFPNFYPLPRQKQQLIPFNEWSNYPAFAEDFKTLERELMPYFHELDNESFRRQNWYRRMYIILIFGGALVTILGIVQIAFINTVWIGIAGAIVALALGSVTTYSRTFKHHERYLNARLVAERLRSEYFLFLGRLGQYANDQDRIQELRKRVIEIKVKGEKHESA
jgi:hypothetical protein